MTTPLRSLLLLACAVPFAALADPAPMTSPLPYPPTKAVPVEQTLHGETFTDPYQWLEDGKAPDVQEWMSAQDGLTRKTLAAIPERAGFEARVKQLIYVDSIGVPFRRGNRLFFSEKKKDQEKAVIYWRPVKGGEAKVVLDPLQFAADGTTSIGSYSPSWDGKLVAYQVKPNNSDTARYEVREVDTGKVLTRDTIEGGRYAGAEWTQDNKAFYYTSYPTDPAIPVDQRPGKTEVRFHVLGTDPATDKVIHPAMNDASVFHSGSLSWDGRWLTLAIDHGWTRNDVLVMDLHAKEPKFVPVFEGKDALFRVDVWKDKMYVWSTQGSPRGALWTVDLLAKDPAAAAAQKLIIPERKDHAIEGFALVGGRLALNTLVDAASRLELYELSGKKVMEVKLPGIGSASGLSGDPRYHEAYFQFESFTYPSEVRELDVKTGKSKVVFKIAVPIKPEDFEVRQIFGTSKDGTRVPVFITQKKGLPKDGQAPTILYGYGGFSVALTPGFSPTRYAWLEKGGVYAQAILRGGSEFGDDWHRAGMRENKQHVFDDYFAAVEALTKDGLTGPTHLVANGGSNGGLLMGAALTQRPELWAGVMCAVPLLDMLRYHLYGTGKTWISEYGSADDPEQYKYLAAYSPYQHVKQGVKYPPTLFLSADADDRVDPMHARKMAAMMQARSSGGPVLLRVEKHSGHGGADKRSQAVDMLADEYAFAWEMAKAKQEIPKR